MIQRRAFLKPGRKPIVRSRLKQKAKRVPMPPGRREEIFERDGYRCRSCGEAVTIWDGHVHHVRFKSHGVDHSQENLILLCGVSKSIAAGTAPPCHSRVHHTTLPKWWLWIVGNGIMAKFVSNNPRSAP